MAIKTVIPKRLLVTCLAVIALALWLAPGGAIEMRGPQAGKTPYDKERLLKVVKLNALSTQEVVSAVQQRGVDFQTTPAVEAEFRQAGARPELVEAIRSNYRAATPAAVTPTSTAPATTARPSAAVPAGPPLSKSEIITMLQGGVAAARVEQFVEVRGVSFTLTPEISREITAAGGNRSLLGAISERASAGHSAPPASSPRATAPAVTQPDYEDLTDQAIAMMQANNANYAINLLQRAVAMDASRPTAYQLLGFAQLYGNGDIFSAERSMRAAIDRGGAAAFRIYHDHDGFFKTFCQGTFFITKSTVSFKADDGQHTFEATDDGIKETGMNSFWGAEYAAFHLKVFRDASRNKSTTYNFAPATTRKPESTLIMNLIKAY
jgi:hypothetical protein